MKTVPISILGLFLIVQCYSSPTHLASNIAESQHINSTTELTKNENLKDQFLEGFGVPPFTDGSNVTIVNIQNLTANIHKRTNVSPINIMENDDVIVIDLEKINKMSPVEYIGRQFKSLWHYLLHGNTKEKKTTFVGRCAKIAKKIGQLIPMVMVGGAVIILKLAFLLLFSLKTIGLLGLLLLLNVGTAAAKLGALFASKKSEHSAQNLHFHVQKNDDHTYSSSSSSHLHGPPYGWDDRNDKHYEGHELYNLYEKLKLEQDLKKLLSSVRGNGYHQI